MEGEEGSLNYSYITVVYVQILWLGYCGVVGGERRMLFFPRLVRSLRMRSCQRPIEK